MVKKGCIRKNSWETIFQLRAVLDGEECALAWAWQRRPALLQLTGNAGSYAGG